jgi:vacuolar-type H+-ATPase subunit F/Vma7
LKKFGIEGTFLNIIKAICDKTIANIIQNERKTETISSKIKNEVRVSTLPTLIQHSAGIPSKSKKTEERNTVPGAGDSCL